MTRIDAISCLLLLSIGTGASPGCQTTRHWTNDFRRGTSSSSESAQQPLPPSYSARSESAAASLESAAAKIDQAAAEPEKEEPSYYAAREAASPSTSSASCKSGCCR